MERTQDYTLVAECLYRSNASGIYYALFKRGGKQIRKSLKTSDRRLAERLLLQLKEKVGGLQPTREQARQTFAEVADIWFVSWRGHLKESSRVRRELAINKLKETFGRVPLRNVTRSMCESWADSRGREVAAASFNLERDTLEIILKYGKREGLIFENPAEVIPRRRQSKVAIVIPTRKQFSMMVDFLSGVNAKCIPAANLIELLAYSGMRKGEANAFCLADVNFEQGLFTVTGGQTGTKNQEARVVPLFPVLRDFLERLVKTHKPRLHDPLVPIADAKKSINRVCKFYRFPHFTHHCLRHFFVSNALEKGVDFKTIAAWVGHKDGGILVAKTYGHLRDSHSFEMAKRITL